MAKDNNKRLTVLSIINAVLLIIAMGGCVKLITADLGAFYIIVGITEFIALIFSVLYYLRGFKKDAALYYKNFMVFFAFTFFVFSLAYLRAGDSAGFTVAESLRVLYLLPMLIYGDSLLLAVSKDLGKKSSYVLGILNIVLTTVPLVLCFIPGAFTFADDQIMTANAILYVVIFITAVTAFIMTAAKYTDKAIRGRSV